MKVSGSAMGRLEASTTFRGPVKHLSGRAPAVLSPRLIQKISFVFIASAWTN